MYSNVRANASHLSSEDDNSLLRASHALNLEHRKQCLKKMVAFKRTPCLEVQQIQAVKMAQDNKDSKGFQTRRELKQHYNTVLKNWIDQHSSHPFPNKKEKAELCSQASITERQLNNWFTNYRRRHLQP
ncbi:Homeobox protein pknox2 [Lobosporangium transversale]|nr:Homeobox protein pknox2 [Lobosporangium transversale]